MNNSQESNRNRRLPRRAGVLSIVMPGLGHIYDGAAVRGIWLMFLYGVFTALTPLAFTQTGLILKAGLLATAAGHIGIWLFAVVDSFRIALRCRPGYALKDYNRWTVYILLVLMGTGSSTAFALYARDQFRQPFVVPSASMVPTIEPRDRVLAIKNAYRKSDPQRGDIVLFPDPDNRSRMYVKRVIAVAGDTVSINSNDLIINGRKLERQSLGNGVFREINNGARYRIFIGDAKPQEPTPQLTVPKYECFVMGDNRTASEDSRQFGPIPVAGITGRFDIRYWSAKGWSRIGRLDRD